MSTFGLTVLIRHGCPFCDMAIDLLDKNNLPYELLILGEDFSREEFAKKVPGAKTFPQILVNQESIGGFEELSDKIENLIHTFKQIN